MAKGKAKMVWENLTRDKYFFILVVASGTEKRTKDE
jgi:hypothetical protein